MQVSMAAMSLTLWLSTALLMPQTDVRSLPEIARQVRAERSESQPAVHVFTSENIRQVGTNLSRSRGPAPVEAAAADDAGEATAGVRTEQEWRALFDDARAEIGRAGNRIRLTEQELQNLNRRLLTESSLFNREGQLLPQITEKEAELEAAEDALVEANQALDDLTEELRRAGGPPAWGR